MRQKHLESILSSAQREFANPDVTLEQYPTSPHLSAATIQAAGDDVGEGRTVLDLGCGTGMLALACAAVDTDMVLAVDCDREALEIAAENAKELELDDRIVFLQARVPTRAPAQSSTKKMKAKSGRGKGRGHLLAGRQSTPLAPLPDCAAGFPLSDNCVDTVLTNPPFGTKGDNHGMDLQFLRLGCRLARRAVYSFHKTSTRAFVLRSMEQESGYTARVVAEMKFDLGRSYKFHKNKSVDIEVDLIRVDVSRNSRGSDEDIDDEDKKGSLNGGSEPNERLLQAVSLSDAV